VALNDYDTGTLNTFSGALNTNTAARAFSQPRQKERFEYARPWKKCIAHGTMGSHVTSVGKKNGVDDLIDATESAAIPVLHPVFFPKERITFGKYSANFC